MDRSDNTSNMLAKTIHAMLEVGTGLCATEKKELILRAGYFFQRIRASNYLQLLKNEWDFFRERGRIKDDYTSTEQHRDCLQEILDSLDEDHLDQVHFELLMKLFITTSAESTYSRTSVVPHQFIRVARWMSSGEILVLNSAYRNYKRSSGNDDCRAARAWLEKIAADSGLDYPELVETFEQELIRKNFLTRRIHADGSGVVASNCRLTRFAIDFCKFVESYDHLKNEAQGTDS